MSSQGGKRKRGSDIGGAAIPSASAPAITTAPRARPVITTTAAAATHQNNASLAPTGLPPATATETAASAAARSTAVSTTASSASTAPVPGAGAAPTAAESSEPTAPPKKKARITKDAKDALHEFFTKSKWPRNRVMPKLNGDKGLDEVIAKFGLERSQASRQLRNWKGIEYEHTQIKLIIDPEDIAIAIHEAMSCKDVDDFVIQFLQDHMLNGIPVPGSTDATNLCNSIKDHRPGELAAVKFLVDSCYISECIGILVKYVNGLTNLAGELFPKYASELSDKELEFMRRKEELKDVLVRQWMDEHVTVTFPPNKTLNKIEFGHFGVFLFNCLYGVWALMLVSEDQAAVEIPTKDLVGKYALKVLYYVAGWTAQRTSLALTVAEEEREKYLSFAKSQQITMEAAREAELPSSLVEERQKKKLFFVTQQYFDFIRLVESIYIHNLTLKMMMAYSNGDLIKTINETIGKSEEVHSKFFALFDNDSEANEADRLEILKYILERYVHMRGCWFVKFMKNNQKKSVGETKAAAAPTRTKCAHSHVTTKSVAKALKDAGVSGESSKSAENKEKAIWDQAAQNVKDYQNDDEPEEANSIEEETSFAYEESDEENYVDRNLKM